MKPLSQEELNNRVCSKCGRNWTHKTKKKAKDGTVKYYPMWHNDKKGGHWCQNCYSLYISTPKHNPKLFARKLKYKGKVIFLSKPPRIGVCSFCRAVKGLINAQTGKLCKCTSIAHIVYHDDNLLKDTLELCISCHVRYDSGKLYN